MLVNLVSTEGRCSAITASEDKNLLNCNMNIITLCSPNLLKNLLMLLLGYGLIASPVIAAVVSNDKIADVEIEITRPDHKGSYPLIIFSHGMGACPTDYSGIQRRMVNAGYVVIAPRHADCLSGSSKPHVPWREPQNWTQTTNDNRKNDMHRVLDALPSSKYAQYINSFEQVGCAGHSMGGYTCMGLAGAWDSWKRDEIAAIALLSPWHKPYSVHERVVKMSGVNTLYQGGSKDRPISVDLCAANGAFAETQPAKYLQIFKRARHSAWTDRVLTKRYHEQMSYYLVSFFDLSLKGDEGSRLEVSKSQVTELRFEH